MCVDVDGKTKEKKEAENEVAAAVTERMLYTL
jgi:hypothetical protein